MAVLGAGLNLEWLRAAWLQDRRIAYWGDLDTWGLLMLSRARERQPYLESVLMSRELFEALAQTSAVVERNPAGEQRPNGPMDLQTLSGSCTYTCATSRKGAWNRRWSPASR